MRLLRKILLKLTVVVVFVIIIYCLQTSNGVYWSINNLTVPNVTVKSRLPSALARNNKSSDYVFLETNTNLNNSLEYYNVWCIFTKVTSNSPMRRKFKIFTESLLRLSSVDVVFHVISDSSSKSIAEKVIQVVKSMTKKNMRVSNF